LPPKKRKLIKKEPPWSGFDEKGKCKLCRQMRTDEGHDPCIANLPGVVFACCGHKHGYIKFIDGRSIDFNLLQVDLEIPTHYIARVEHLIPLWVDGETHKVLNMQTGRKRVEKSHGTPINTRFRKLVMDPIEGNETNDQET
jgi:hypothetical protein